MKALFCIGTLIAFFPSRSECSFASPSLCPPTTRSASNSAYIPVHGYDIRRIAGDGFSANAGRIGRGRGTQIFAFPDSRKHNSRKKGENRKTPNQKSQRQYKRVEEYDTEVLFDSDRALFGTVGLFDSNPDSDRPPKASTSPLPQSKPVAERKFRNKNKQAAFHANANRRRKGNNSNSNANQKYNHHNNLFTRNSLAPPLEKFRQNDINKKTKENIILSPSVVQNNQQECMTYICGELPITYTNDPSTLEHWLTENCERDFGSTHYALGFDVEAAPNLPWRKPVNPDFNNRPATVQLSTPYSSIVVHLTRRPDNHRAKSVLSPLIACLSDESILKVGVGIDEDMLELYRWNKNLDAKSRFDIGGIGSDSNRSRVGLQKLVRAIVGVELQKSKKIAMSDWSKIPLQAKQLQYASRDAWAGAAVMENIGKMYDDMQVDSIASLVRDRGERSMADVDMRAKTRKSTKTEVKMIMDQMKEMTSFLNGDGDGEKTMSGRERHENLLKIMPAATKREMKRLQNIMDETAPDDLIFFEAEKLGLDFTFVN